MTAALAAGTAHAPGIPTVSLLDSLQYNLFQVLPSFTQGLFTRNRRWVSFWARVHPDPLGVALISRWRRVYGAPLLYVFMLAKRSLLVTDPASIRRVLENSPTLYADPKLKRKGMSHFQPGAVTISRGAEWEDRRRFNEAVLDRGGAEEYAAGFLRLVAGETADCTARAGAALGWGQLETLFERIALGVLFGDAAREDASLLNALKAMMRESNRVVLLRKSRHFDTYYERVRHYLASPAEGSLAAACGHVPASVDTRVEAQLTHWLFAMGETLGANVARAFALIAAHPLADARVREELSRADVSTPDGVHGLKYLEGCVQESMRLWPTTPLLARETLADDTLGGARIPAGTQLLIPNGFMHRDPDTVSAADRFTPERWLGGERDYRFNHFSSGAQVCPGEPLALFLAKAALAHLLAAGHFTLLHPALDVTRPLPHALDTFRLALRREDVSGD